MKKLLSLAALALGFASGMARAESRYLETMEFIGESRGGSSADLAYRDFDSMVTKLTQDFDDVCGDTFCEGEYSNIMSLGLTCAVEVKSETVKSCVWLFAGSNSEVDGQSGTVRTNDKKFFECKVEVDTKFDDLVKALNSTPDYERAIHTALPSGKDSFYDQIVGCL